MRAGNKLTAAFVAVLVAGLAIAYGGGFGIGFYFDDGHGIRENAAIHSLANIPSFFVDPYALTSLKTNIDYRPVVVTSYALNYAISGLDPWSYHALNLVLHFVAALFVFVLVRDWLWWPAYERGPGSAAEIPAAAAALFFAFAPVNSQAIDYMWARSALLCTVFYLAAFHALVRKRWTAAYGLHVLALLTKTIAVTLPLVFVVYDFLYRDRRRHPGLRQWMADWQRIATPVAVLLALDVAYVVFRAWLLPDWVDDYLHEQWVTSRVWFVSQWSALVHYVTVFVWPSGLSVDYDFPYNRTGFEPRALLSLAVLAAWFVAALASARRQPLFTFATLWFFLTLAPESSILPLAEVVNDHRPYIASTLGLSVLLVLAVDRLSSLARTHRSEVFALATGMLCAGGVAVTNHRTWEWADGMRLWDATVRESPNNGRAWMNAGLEYMKVGRYDEARVRFEKARDLNPNYAYVYMNLSVLEAAQGDLAKAESLAREAVRIGPELSRSHYYLGSALEKSGRTAEASAEFGRALAIEPRDPNTIAALDRTKRAAAGATAAASSPGGAANVFENSPHAAANSPAVDATARMTNALHLLDVERNPDAAIAELRALLAENPSHYGGHWQLARALDVAGRRAEARNEWQAMLALTQQWKNAGDEEKVRARLAQPN